MREMSEGNKKPLLICFPGSGGRFGRDLKSLLLSTFTKFFEVRLLEAGDGTPYPGKKLWLYMQNPGKHLEVSNGPDGVPNPVEYIRASFEECGNDGRDYYLFGASYGCRVVACLLAGGDKYFSSEEGVGQSPKGAIMFGYPLYKKPDNDKAASLALTIPAGTRILFLSGSQDKTYLGLGSTTGAPELLPTKGLTGGELLRTFVSTMPCSSTATVVMTPSRHDITDTKVADRVPALRIATNSVLDFVEESAGLQAGSLGRREGFPFEEDEDARGTDKDEEKDGDLLVSERTSKSKRKRQAEPCEN